MINNFIKSCKETTITIIPIALLIIFVSLLFGVDSKNVFSFIISSVLLIIGISFFTFGADISMMIIGEKIGSALINSRKTKIILLVTFLIGVIITMAEPDLKVLATQLTSIPEETLILVVSLGIGLFLMLSAIKILFKLEMRTILIISYLIIFALLCFSPQEFIPVAFDASGVTTGPISVPFILALGVGLTSFRTDKESKNDTFGLIALCSIGPIITVLILGLLFHGTSTYDASIYTSNLPLITSYLNNFVTCLKDVLFCILPVFIVYLIFKTIKKDTISKRENRKIILGFIITFIGLTLFLTGANVGYMKIGYQIGELFINHEKLALLLPFGMIIGFLIILVEPAVKILNNEVENITEGSISKSMMQISLSIGTALAICLSLIRIATGISILYFLIPGYIIALVLMFISPKIFTSIAFDAGGSVSGPLTATFILPLAIGASSALGGNIFTDAFGLVALIAMSPLITIQLLGFIFKIKTKQEIYSSIDEEIIEYDWRSAL